MKAQFSVILFALTLTLSIFVIQFEARKVAADNVIFIRADGQIDPQTAPIERNGDLYTLINNILSSRSGIIIERSNMTLNGANHIIQGANLSDSGGIYIYNSFNVTIKNVTLKGFDYGIMFSNSSNNHIIENSIEANNYGICLNNSSYNHFFHNNFLYNSCYIFLQNSINSWDNGYPSGGNYWSSYLSVDEFGGHYQNETNSDGICDEPKEIDANNLDHYPLLKIWRGSIRNLVTGESYSTIQQAIDNAENTERILALAKIYQENVKITKNIELLGECPNSTIIDGNWNGITLSINASKVKIKGFSIINGSPTNLAIFNSSDNVLMENYITRSVYGVLLDESINNTIAENEIEYAKYGISALNCSENRISNNRITFCSDSAISLTDSNNNTINKNTIERNFDGIKLFNSSGNIIIENIVRMNRNCGIKIESTSDYNFVNDNVIEQNENHGIVLYSSSYNNIYNNNMTLNAASGVILYMYSNCNLIAHNTAKLNFKGVELGAFSGNNNVSENNLVDNNYGVILDTSQNNTIFANNLICSKYYGVYLYSSPNNTIINNKIRNGFTGIFLYMSSQNLLSNNLLTNNTYNLEVDGKNISHFINQIDTSNVIEEKPVYYLINKQNFTVPLDAGYIAMVNCSEITVRDQSLSHNAEGVLLAYTTNTTIVANNITNNRCGIHLHSSSNNLIYHNNFVNNIRNVYTFNSINVFDNGFEGNYWSTCSVQDSNKDGIGDIPYIIDDDSKDNFPLMGTFYSYSIAERVYVEIISNLTIKKIELIEANSTIKISTLEASTDQAQGFCRLTIPHAVISPPYNIVINDSPMASKLVFENENLSIIYCSYPDQIIQEFHVFVILLLFITLTLITLIFHKIRFCGH